MTALTVAFSFWFSGAFGVCGFVQIGKGPVQRKPDGISSALEKCPAPAERRPWRRAVPMALLALMTGLVYELAKQSVALSFTIWQFRSIDLAFFTFSAFCVSVIMLRAQDASLADMRQQIESRRSVEEQLRLQTSALDAAANSVVITDAEGKIVWINPAFTALTGYTAQEAIGQMPSLLKSGEHDPEFYRDLWKTISSGKVWRGEITNRRKDASLYTEEMTITPVQNAAGMISHYIAIKTDSTERRRAELELRQLNRALSTLSRCNETLVHASNEDQLLNEICRILVQIGGYRLAWIGYAQHDQAKSVRVMAKAGFDDGYLEKAQIEWGDTERGAGPVGTSIRSGNNVVIRNVLKDPQFALWREEAARRGYAAVAALPLRCQWKTIGALAIYASEPDAFDGQEIDLLNELAHNLAYGIAALQNARDCVEAETALRESEERYRLLFTRTPQPLFVFDVASKRFLDVNEAALAQYRYTREEFLQLTTLDIRPPEDIPAHLALLATAKEGYRFRGNFQHRKKDGTVFDVEIASYKFMKDGRLVSLTLANDVTERKHAERALRASEERYRMLYEHNLAAVFHSWKGKMLDCNEAMCQMLGFSRAELLAMDLRSLYCNPADREKGQDLLYAQGYLFNHQVELRRKDGSSLTVLANLNLVQEYEGAAQVVVGVMLDITEVRKLQAQLVQSQKLEALGHLTGGIAHDFNNVLMIINAYCEMLLEMTEPESQFRGPLEQIQSAGDRAVSLTRQLLAFSRKQMVTPITLNLAAVVSGLEKMLRRLIGEDISVDLASVENLWLTKADPSQIEQVLLNLAVNARDAMSSGGNLSVRTFNAELGEEFTSIHSGSHAGQYVALVVSDSGCGISPDVCPHIFEPFFTTKERGKGTGLGLSTVYGIVKQNNGYITVESKPGRGTAFCIYLPRTADAQETPEIEIIELKSGHARQISVFLVEDEDATREAIAAYLGQNGYRVFTAANGQEALRRSEAVDASQIDVLLTDVVMPGMNGTDLAEKFQLQHPETKVVLMSGYSDDVLMRSGIQAQAALLTKPFRLPELGKKLKEIFASTAQA